MTSIICAASGAWRSEVFVPLPCTASAVERLRAHLRSLDGLNLRVDGDRAVLKARCFKIAHLCRQIREDVNTMVVSAAADPSESGLLEELGALDAFTCISAGWLAKVYDRAKLLEALL